DAGSMLDQQEEQNADRGHEQADVRREDRLRPRFQPRQFEAGWSRGKKTAHERLHQREEVGNAGQVGQDPVAVEPYEGHELPNDLEVDEKDGDEQEALVERQRNADQAEDEDEMEVDAAEAGANSRPSAQAVAVGDVGVEDGE